MECWKSQNATVKGMCGSGRASCRKLTRPRAWFSDDHQSGYAAFLRADLAIS